MIEGHGHIYIILCVHVQVPNPYTSALVC